MLEKVLTLSVNLFVKKLIRVCLWMNFQRNALQPMLFLFTKREIVMLLQQIIIVVLLLSAVHDCSLWVEL